MQPRLVRKVAETLNIPQYRVWADERATRLYKNLLRKTLFIELSDGARIDVFRRANAGIVGNEQIVTAPRINRYKWKELLDDLRKATGVSGEQFALVYLVDDFIGSGTTLLRKEDEIWKGKLMRFWDDVQQDGVLGTHFEPGWTLCVHHYLSSHRAHENVRARDAEIRAARGKDQWFELVEFSNGVQLPEEFPINLADDPAFARLIEHYYDNSIENQHIKKGGDNARMGFGQSALPLVLEHNTPNNAIALLWAETPGEIGQHAMRPLFRRRQRHI